MEQPLDISEVARRTGLTPRALRFYEAQHLVRPLRTASGRRLYGSGELHRLNQLVALKSAGFALADIGRLLDRRPLDLGRLIAAQLEALDAQAARMSEARRLLVSVKSRVDRGEPLDAETLCSLIRTGGTDMEQESWKKVADRYFSPEEQAHWAARMPAGSDFDPDAYNRQWAALGEKVAARLPLDPGSDEAQALFDEWQALLEPFTRVASPAMMAGAAKLYDKMPEWHADRKPPFPMEVWAFVKAAGAARTARG